MASGQDSVIDETVDITKTNEADNDRFAMVLVVAAQRSDADRVWHDIEQDRQKVLAGNVSGGLLEAIAEHSFNPEVVRELLADPAFAQG